MLDSLLSKDGYNEDLKELLLMVLSIDPECIVLVNSAAQIVWLNKAYEAYLGISCKKAVGHPVTEIIDNTRLHIVVRTGVTELADTQTIRGRHAIVNRIPINKNGKTVGAVGKVIFKTSNEVYQLISKVSLLENEVDYYKRKLSENFISKWSLNDIITCSRDMQKVKKLTCKLASADVNILILGESGTGKELFAHSIHSHSKRNKKPFVYINCAAIPESLLESELFGYESGTFTNAKRNGKTGKLEIANGGTLFLDEIGDMPLPMQAKILRFLQEGELEKVGSLKPVHVNVRVVSATNRDIKKMIEKGTFRADLYYRLSGAVLEIPPLRQRPEDIKALCEHFLAQIADKWMVPIKRLDAKASERLTYYTWPGNVRELQNLLERLYCICDEETVEIRDLPPPILNEFSIEEDSVFNKTLLSETNHNNGNLDASLHKVKNNAEKIQLEKTLKKVEGNKTKAAELLGIHRTTLYYKLRKHNLLK